MIDIDDIEDLSKEEVLSELLKTAPRYHPFKHELVSYCGELNDGEWIWNQDRLSSCRHSQLEKMYIFCKNSWL